MEGLLIHLMLLVILICLSGIFSSSEIALVNLTPSQIRRIIKQDRKLGKRLILWEKDPDRILITIAIGNNLANIAASATAVTIFVRAFPAITIDSAAAIATFVTTLLVLIFGEVTPKLLGKRHPVALSLRLMPLLLFLARAFGPLSAALWKVSRFILRCLGKEKREALALESGREEVKTLLDLVKTEGILSERENKMLKSILHLGEITVRDIMVNRMHMVCLEIGTGYDEVLECIRKTGFSRIPVYEGDPENMQGIVMAKDLLSHWEQKSFELATLIRPVSYVPEVITIDHALREFMNTPTHLAIVVNEYGGVEGLVTLEDVIERITGEIQDEFDAPSILIKKVRDTALHTP